MWRHFNVAPNIVWPAYDLYSSILETFADDANMFITERNVNEMCNQLNADLFRIQEWLHCNKLALNVIKTYYVTFTPRNKVVDDISIIIDSTKISRVYVTKFWCVQTDSQLSWKCITIIFIARRLDQYISQACKRTFRYKININKQGRKYPAWYDVECRDKRSLAIKAGERVTHATEKEQQDAACREYRACKQRKERVYYRKCVNDIKTAYTTDRTRLWKLLDKISKENGNHNEPEDSEFYHHFKKLSSPEPAEYFDSEYEYTAIEFLGKYE